MIEDAQNMKRNFKHAVGPVAVSREFVLTSGQYDAWITVKYLSDTITPASSALNLNC
jgi:hypothetical protein